jgi:hypothetical protein
MVPFGCADKPAEKQCCLIYCERKTLFWLKNKLKSTDYKPAEKTLWPRLFAHGVHQNSSSVWTKPVMAA